MVVFEPTRAHVLDPRTVLLLRPVLEVLAHPLCALGGPALPRDRLVGHVAIRRRDVGCRDHRIQLGIHRVDIGDVRRRLRVGEAPAVGAVVRDRAAVGLIPAHRELDHAHAERGGGRGDRAVVDPVDPRRAAIGDVPVGAVGPHAPADAVARLQHDDAVPGLHQQSRRGHPGHAGPHDDGVEFGHDVLPLPNISRQAAAGEESRAQPVLRTSASASSRLARIAAHRSTSSRVPDSSNSNSTGRPDRCDRSRAAAW